MIREVDRSRFGVAEADDGRVVGVVHNEHDAAVAYLQRRPDDDAVVERLPDLPAPPGTVLRTLAEDGDHAEVHRVLWHGFDNDGPPPPEGIESGVSCSRRRTSAPT